MPFNVDTTPEPGMPPGVYYVEVSDAKEKRSNKTGDGMFEVTFVAVDRRKQKLCRDYIMVEGKARGMGIQKLQALGLSMTGKTAVIGASDLIGKRAYVNVIVEEREHNGKLYADLKVARLDKGDVGYFNESEPPESYSGKAHAPKASEEDEGDPLDVDSVPF
jgi:Protein of unknown function (DUF669).